MCAHSNIKYLGLPSLDGSVGLLQLPHLLQHLLLRPVEAIEDADKALAQNGLSTKAIIAKVPFV